MSLKGFAESIANHPGLRHKLLEGKPLLSWQSPELVGVVNLKSLGLNIEVMMLLADVWCPQWTGPITTPVGLQKQQAELQNTNL